MSESSSSTIPTVSASLGAPTAPVNLPSLLNDVVLRTDDDDGVQIYNALSNELRNNALRLLPLDKLVHNARTLCDMASHLCSEALKISKKEAKSADAATKSARRGLADLLSVSKNNPVKTLTRDDTNKVDKRSDFVRQAGCRIHAWMGLYIYNNNNNWLLIAFVYFVVQQQTTH